MGRKQKCRTCHPNPNYPPPTRYSGNQDTAAMLDCICQIQLTVQEHVLTNSKQAEYHVSQNADLFTETARGQKRRDLEIWQYQRLMDKSQRSAWTELIG